MFLTILIKMNFLIILIFVLPYAYSDNYLNTSIHDCVKCLCHAISGCYIRQNCAKYSINKEYWMDASSPVVNDLDNPADDSSYKKCMQDENCIVETIYKYTELYKTDCNCDGQYDCKDRLAIHIFGANCINPLFGIAKSRRYNNCRKMYKNIDIDAMSTKEELCDIIR